MTSLMKTILVTGSTGALGRALAARIGQDARYRLLTAGRGPGHDVHYDLRDAQAGAERIAAAGADCVIQLAAGFGNELPESYAQNVDAPRALLDAVQASGKRTRVVLVGSAAEYGVVEPTENPIRVDRVLKPVSVYGMTKAWQTQLAGVMAARGMDVVVARIFNLDGPGLAERLFAGRLQRQIERVRAGEQSVIELGPLGATRDYISTAQAAEQLLAIADHAPSGSIHHVASGTPTTMREYARAKLAEVGLDWSIVREALELSNRTGYDVPMIYADVSATRALLSQWRKRAED
ncbi:MAG: NAD-dependent epimerase/dehydratase family protein [Gammaproteobacteria bacterium]